MTDHPTRAPDHARPRRHGQDRAPRRRAAHRPRPRRRVGSRSGEPPFDWENRATWALALRSVTAAYVSYFPNLAVAGAPATVGDFAALAVERDFREYALATTAGGA